MHCKFAIAIFTLAFALNLNSQQLQKGVHVQLAPTENALPIAAADEPNAWIVAVTADSTLYFGVDQVTPDALLNDLISHPRNRDQHLFIKADADAPYSAVESALNAARRASFADCILLTGQKDMPMPGERELPSGLEVLLQAHASTSKLPFVELFASSDQTPAVKINHRPVAWASLQNVLTGILMNRGDRNVVVNAEDKVPFSAVAHVIDIAHSLGSEVILQ